jgi:nucleotide-binding universal stress UspA family protein
MQAKVIISYDGTENDHDALALGRIFGDAGAQVSLAYVRHSAELDPRVEADVNAEAEALLARGAEWLGHPEVGRHVIVNGSTGEGLRALAEAEQADVVVFGSDVHTAPGSVQPGRSALRMMAGGRSAVAIASARLRDREQSGFGPVALAGGEVDPAARRTAEKLAEQGGTPLALPSQEGVNLLVIGSRPGADEGHVSLSSAAEYLVETARSSVLVLARGVAFDAVSGSERVGAASTSDIDAA